MIGSMSEEARSVLPRPMRGHRIIVDAEADTLADGFSAEVELGWRFVLRS